MTVDLMYLAKNRLEFTRESFSQLRQNTDWNLVRQLHIYDDGSVDGTLEYLVEQFSDADLHISLPVGGRVSLRQTQIGSPVAIMNDFLDRTTGSQEAPLIAKIDNDTVVPPRWLNSCVDVLAESPKLQCLGIEAFNQVNDDPHATRGWTPCRFTGGIGVFRRLAFRRSRPRATNIYFGFGDWQQKWKIQCGWIAPSMPVFLLDRLPIEPWATLSREYMAQGWQRDGARYTMEQRELWDWRFPDA